MLIYYLQELKYFFTRTEAWLPSGIFGFNKHFVRFKLRMEACLLQANYHHTQRFKPYFNFWKIFSQRKDCADHKLDITRTQQQQFKDRTKVVY